MPRILREKEYGILMDLKKKADQLSFTFGKYQSNFHVET